MLVVVVIAEVVVIAAVIVVVVVVVVVIQVFVIKVLPLTHFLSKKKQKEVSKCKNINYKYHTSIKNEIN